MYLPEESQCFCARWLLWLLFISLSFCGSCYFPPCCSVLSISLLFRAVLFLLVVLDFTLVFIFLTRCFYSLTKHPQAPIPRHLNVKVCLSALLLCRLLLYRTHSCALSNIVPFVTHFAMLLQSSLPIIVRRPFLNCQHFCQMVEGQI